MGKAFTENEKEKIRIKLLETGVEMFHDNSVRAVNIRELTRRAGISQGGFYTFYKDKDELVMDIIRYRSRQKIHDIESSFDKSLSDPAGFLADVAFNYYIDIKHKADEKKKYADVFAIFMKDPQDVKRRIRLLFRSMTEGLVEYWRENDAKVTADVDGICNVLAGAFLMFIHADMIENEYFDDIFRTYIDSGIHKYIKTTEAAE